MDFTEGSVAKKMFIFATPLFFSNLLQAVYNVVDMVIVGQVLGSVGISAISIGGDVQNFLTFVAMGFSNAGQIIIAQHIGAGKQERIRKIVGNLFSLLIGVALVLSVISFLLRDIILSLMNTPSEAYGYALSYATTCIVGLIFIYGYNVVSAILRGMGDSRHPFQFIATAAILNLVLDLVFIVGFHMAALGAALATVIGQGTSFLWGLSYLYRNRKRLNLELSLYDLRPDPQILKLVLRLGIPMAVKSAAVQVSKLFVNSSINAFGVIESSASGIESKLNMIANLVANAVNVSCSTMIGQNVGAGNFNRVPKIMRTAFSITLLCAAVMMGVVFTFPDALFGIFTSDAAVIAACNSMTLVLCLVFIGSALRTPNNGLIDGTGNYKLNFVVAILDGIVNRIFFAILFGSILGMGWIGYLYGDAVAGFTPFAIGGIYYLSGKWRTKKYV